MRRVYTCVGLYNAVGFGVCNNRGKFIRMTEKDSLRGLFNSKILPWVVCGLAAAFYCYEYLLRITPGLMVPNLQLAFSVKGMPLDATMIGHLSAFYYYAYWPMQLPVGLFMDRYGPRWILTMAVFCCAAGTALFASTTSYWVAASGRFAIGFGSAFAFVGVLKLASTWLPANRFAMVSGMTTTLGMVGAMLGGVILTDLIQSMGWRDTLIYSSYIGFVLVPIVWLIIRDTPPQGLSNVSPPVPRMSYAKLWSEIRFSMKNPQIWLAGIVGGLLMTPTIVFPELWGKLYLQTVHHLEEAESSHAVIMIFLGWAFGGPIAGFISDSIRRRKLPLIIGGLLTTILLLFFFYYPGLTLFQLKVLMFFIGVTSSVEVICFALGRENCPTSLAGTAIAVTNFLVVGFSFFQVVVAKILDYTWTETDLIVDQAKVYSAESYQIAMFVLPAATFLGFLVSFLLKETYCEAKQ